MTEDRILEVLEWLGVPSIGTNSGGWVVAPCPFAEHKHAKGTDRSPSFMVKIEAGGVSGYNCFTCKSHGRMGQLVREIAYLRSENYEKYASKVDWWDIPDSFTAYDEQILTKGRIVEALDEDVFEGLYPPAWESRRAREYLVRRGITKLAAWRLGLLYDPEDKRVVFPVRDREGSLFGFTGRTVLAEDEYPHQWYGKVKDYAGLAKDCLLLGEHLYKEGKPVLLVEGLMAVARVVSVGGCKVCNPMAVMGSRLLPEQADRLFAMGDPVYLLFDDDEAGDAGLYGPRWERSGTVTVDGAIGMLSVELPTFVCYYPKGKNDVDKFEFEDVDYVMSPTGSIVAPYIGAKVN